MKSSNNEKLFGHIQYEIKIMPRWLQQKKGLEDKDKPVGGIEEGRVCRMKQEK
jgi:hypothetical protein